MNWADTAEAITELAVALPGYREEEAPLYPLIVLCDDLNATIGLVEQRVHIGKGRRNARTASEALKKCAPLAQGGWCIFLERSSSGLSYGVFRPSTLAFAVDPQEVFETAILENNRVCVIRSLARDMVELLEDHGRALHLTLSARHTETMTFPGAIKALISHIIGGADSEAQGPTKKFLTTTLTRAVQDCHGTIIAVQDVNASQNLCSGLWLEEPIDVAREVMEVERVLEKAGVSRLQGTDHLIRGMVRSDGITIFSSDAKLLAFNSFIQLPATIGRHQGGARSRAFEALASHIGKGIRAAVKISQDGGVVYKDRSPRR